MDGERVRDVGRRDREIVLAMFSHPDILSPCQTLPRFAVPTPDAIVKSLVFALRREGRKPVHHADDIMAWIAAGRLICDPERSGFVVMKRRRLRLRRRLTPNTNAMQGIRTPPVTRHGNTC